MEYLRQQFAYPQEVAERSAISIVWSTEVKK